MPTPIDLDKVIFEAPSYSHFLDVRESPAKIINKKKLTTRNLIQEATPVLKLMARDYIFSKGGSVDYKQIIGFLTYVAQQME